MIMTSWHIEVKNTEETSLEFKGTTEETSTQLKNENSHVIKRLETCGSYNVAFEYLAKNKRGIPLELTQVFTDSNVKQIITANVLNY